ncbi:MAG: hypothetical protein M9894_08470 [Planctomycetes bacterium]|nr:hypothetical protein [Planctomycetota bacterium]
MTRAPLIAAALALLALAGPARAHRLNVEARLEAGRVVVEVYFSDGTVPVGAEVVASREGVEVARGRTDAAGLWTFAPPGAGRYALAVTEPGLHRGRAAVDVRAADLPAVEAGPPAPEAAPPPTRRDGTDWVGLAAGLAIITLLALGLGRLQRARRP